MAFIIQTSINPTAILQAFDPNAEIALIGSIPSYSEALWIVFTFLSRHQIGLLSRIYLVREIPDVAGRGIQQDILDAEAREDEAA